MPAPAQLVRWTARQRSLEVGDSLALPAEKVGLDVVVEDGSVGPGGWLWALAEEPITARIRRRAEQGTRWHYEDDYLIPG
jgi:hypothetical protein